MPQILRTLSQLLESGRPILTADDVAWLDADSRDTFLNQGILVPARTATHVVCDACHDDHVEEVTRIKGPKGDVSFRIRCPDAGWVIVADERLRQWTIDVRRLVALLAEGAGSGEQPEQSLGGVAWRLGSVEVGGDLYGLALLLNCDSADVLSQVSAKFPPGQTILICAGGALTDATGFAAAISLGSAFEFVGERFVLQLNRIRSVITTGATTNSNVFQRRGEYWQTSFEGETQFFKDTVGLGYIARLLAEPHRDIPAVTLLAARAGIDPLVTSGSSGELLDDQARAEYGRRYRELLEELQEARANNDLGITEKLEGEMEALTNELANATGLGGRSREKSDIEKVRKSVSMAVSRDIERIGKKHESLCRHLIASIKAGLTFRYAPERVIQWLT